MNLRERKRALILVNVGSPESVEPRVVRKFLREFLGDVDVLSCNYFLRKFLAFLISQKRWDSYATRLQKISRDSRNILRVLTESLASKTQAKLANSGAGDVAVFAAYRYGGNLSIKEAIMQARNLGVDKFFFIPLFPQSARSTTETAKKEIIANMRAGEYFKILDSYFDNDSYIGALANTLKDCQCDALVASFHSVPLSHLKNSPYAEHCAKTVSLLKDKLGGKFANIEIAWQSKMGKGKWLEPSVEDVCASLAKRGAKRVGVICAGFAVDCSETLLDIAEELRENFIGAGGEDLFLVPALNDSDAQVKLMLELFQSMQR